MEIIVDLKILSKDISLTRSLLLDGKVIFADRQLQSLETKLTKLINDLRNEGLEPLKCQITSNELDKKSLEQSEIVDNS